MALLIITGILFLCYTALIIFYDQAWRRLPVYKPKQQYQKAARFSVIIPARNEEKNIGALLTSLRQQSYPKEWFEVIVVDDHSDDDTAEVITNVTAETDHFHLIRMTGQKMNSYKKKAIETGIAAAQYEWIICTDADCVAPPGWLSVFAGFIAESDPVFIAAPVRLMPTAPANGKENTPLFIFQSLDFISMQGITGASVYKNAHNMCNGANLAYKKQVFYEVNGFKGIDAIASGDDMLLMHKIWKQYPDKIAYLKSREAIVNTLAAPLWKDFFNQRIRWASKAKYYDDQRIFWVLLLVYFLNVSFFVLLTASFFSIKYFYALLVLWFAKTLVELPFMVSVSRFFNRQKLLRWFFFFQPVHIAYIIISGFLGIFGKYEWKGRRVK